MDNRSLTAIEGLRVGHWTDPVGRTGCTAILCPPQGCVASAAFHGPSPGTREGVLLAPEKSVDRLHALVLTGGSAFGLASADGVMRVLAEQGVGWPTPAGPVPIVAAAVLFDLLVGDPKARPTAESGRLAALAANSDPVVEGPVGAGAGATAGKYLSPEPSGLGSALATHGDLSVAALAAVNPVGDVHHPSDGRLLAGHGRPDAFMQAALAFGHTTLVCVATRATLTKAQACQLADVAQAALGLVIRPARTPWDGDACFVLSTGADPPAAPAALSALTQRAVCEAIVRATPAGRATPPTAPA